MTYSIESLLSARQVLSPHLVGDRIYFASDLSGRMSLHAIDRGGSAPEPLLPADIALHNPEFVGGELFYAFPKLSQLVVMIDRDGDENYQPFAIPLEGGTPEPLLGDTFAERRVFMIQCDPDGNRMTILVEAKDTAWYDSYLVELPSAELLLLGSSKFLSWPVGHNADWTKFMLVDAATVGDHVLYQRVVGESDRVLVSGTPIEERPPDFDVVLNSFGDCHYTDDDQAVIVETTLFDDRGGLAYLPFADPDTIEPVGIDGLVHTGTGEWVGIEHLATNRYLLEFNIDGCSWGYEASYDTDRRRMSAERVLWGIGDLSDGVCQHHHRDPVDGHWVVTFSTATSPAQIYTIDPEGRMTRHTDEQLHGIPGRLMAPGEDASYESHDGLRVSARLYLPHQEFGFGGPRPVVFYIHGGPQGQERPDFTWFSMPLIQFLALNGFAVFVPNVRGSTGYGLAYTKQVDRDWGGQDRLDHVAASHLLRADPRLDMDRVGVMGRSYGGYMTLILAGLHPDLWQAACDMFGPYDLGTWMDRAPEAWKPYLHLSIGDPEQEGEFLTERSPKTHLGNLACPLLVIQGRNDPRVVAAESEDLFDDLRKQGKDVDLIIYEDEGHDMVKPENKADCYRRITHFFTEHLQP